MADHTSYGNQDVYNDGPDKLDADQMPGVIAADKRPMDLISVILMVLILTRSRNPNGEPHS